MRAIKITIPDYGNHGYILSNKEIETIMTEIDIMFEDGEIGDKLQLELIELTEEEFNNLEEFTGW